MSWITDCSISLCDNSSHNFPNLIVYSKTRQSTVTIQLTDIWIMEPFEKQTTSSPLFRTRGCMFFVACLCCDHSNNGFLVCYSDPIWIADHSAIRLLWTLWIPDMSGNQMVTVLGFPYYPNLQTFWANSIVYLFSKTCW